MIEVDVVVIGAGFAGSLSALLLRRMGRSVALIDKASHPRFAIGESSTPIASMVLRDLARRYDLPQLAELSTYGQWRKKHSELVCGRKRGFSYFHHRENQPFQTDNRHSSELMVAASGDDEHCDTHWLRADVDHYLAEQAKQAGVLLFEKTTIQRIDQTIDKTVKKKPRWLLQCSKHDKPLEIEARFIIDASGAASVLPRRFNLKDKADDMLTHSRCLFSHFVGVMPWQDVLQEQNAAIKDYPFSSDRAALHQILVDGWMWQLRFDNGITSAGFVLDQRKRPRDCLASPDQEWAKIISRYPSLDCQFAKARLAKTPGTLIQTDRLQRRCEKAVGENWALLPHTFGFVDPLHSSGIAHSLCGVERLMRILEECWRDDEHSENNKELQKRLNDYEQVLQKELTLIDQLVNGCYTSLSDFRLLTTYSMLYFAAATTYERRRSMSRTPFTDAFLLADDADFCERTRKVLNKLEEITSANDAAENEITAFASWAAELIKPFNTAGLFDPTAENMIRYTVAPM